MIVIIRDEIRPCVTRAEDFSNKTFLVYRGVVPGPRPRVPCSEFAVATIRYSCRLPSRGGGGARSDGIITLHRGRATSIIIGTTRRVLITAPCGRPYNDVDPWNSYRRLRSRLVNDAARYGLKAVVLRSFRFRRVVFGEKTRACNAYAYEFGVLRKPDKTFLFSVKQNDLFVTLRPTAFY